MNARLAAIAVDCRDPAELADFYKRVLGLEVTFTSPDLVTLSGSGIRMNFERVVDHQRPTWPTGTVPKQLHLDLVVSDLDTEENRIVALGAVKAEVQPDPAQWRVLIDPAGHPFCIIGRPS